MLPSLRLLRYFVAAAECGTVTMAATSLNVSQPSISAAIAQLESELGVQLFIRQHARGISLTNAGTEVLREARNLLGHADEFWSSALSLGAELRGKLSIGVFATIAPMYLAQIVSEFAKLEPEIHLNFWEGNQKELMKEIYSGSLEIAITYDLGLPEDFSVEVLVVLPPFVLLSSDHPLANKKGISIHEISDEAFILFDLPITSKEYFPRVFSSLKLNPKIKYRSKSVEVVRSLVSKGLGYSILNQPIETSATYDGSTVRAVPLTDKVPAVRLVAIRQAQLKPRRVSEAFLSFCRGFFSGQGVG